MSKVTSDVLVNVLRHVDSHNEALKKQNEKKINILAEENRFRARTTYKNVNIYEDQRQAMAASRAERMASRHKADKWTGDGFAELMKQDVAETPTVPIGHPNFKMQMNAIRRKQRDHQAALSKKLEGKSKAGESTGSEVNPKTGELLSAEPQYDAATIAVRDKQRSKMSDKNIWGEAGSDSEEDKKSKKKKDSKKSKKDKKKSEKSKKKRRRSNS